MIDTINIIKQKQSEKEWAASDINAIEFELYHPIISNTTNKK